jgi:lipopolysaccharide heptosyltransferase II
VTRDQRPATGAVPSSGIPPIDERQGLKARVRRAGLSIAGALYRRAPQPTVAPRSVLLIRPDHLGDMLFLTPALHALRAALPDARLTVLAGPWSVDVLRGNPDVDEVLACAFPGFARRPKGDPLAPYRFLYATAATLRGRHSAATYDTAVVLRFDHWWGAWLAAAAGIPRRIGYDWPETRPFLTQALPYTPGRHEAVQNGTLLAALAAASGWTLGATRFAVSAADHAWAADWLASHGWVPGRPLVSIHPGAGAAVKQWPPAAWAAVADALAQEDSAAILLTGSAGERPLTQAVKAAARRAVACMIDAAGETTLGQLAALQARCAAVLGSDSGPLHLAVAVNTPTVHLYGPVPPAKFGPWVGETLASQRSPTAHVVLLGDCPCAPCDRLDWPASVLGEHRCMETIAPEQVIAAARGVMRNTSRRG